MRWITVLLRHFIPKEVGVACETTCVQYKRLCRNYVHFDLLSMWETPQKWAWLMCVGVVGVVCPGSPF